MRSYLVDDIWLSLAELRPERYDLGINHFVYISTSRDALKGDNGALEGAVERTIHGQVWSWIRNDSIRTSYYYAYPTELQPLTHSLPLQLNPSNPTI